MLSSCILSIGKEIISGIINDTNSFFISSKLTAIGIYNRYIIALDDEEQDIIDCFKRCLDKVDIVISTGGLGPTFDDITIQSVAKALNKKLILSENSYKRIEKFYLNLFKEGKIDYPEMNDKRKKMAYVPEGAVELDNKTGAASGIYIKENKKHIFCLPGVPKEFKPMFEFEVLSILKKMSSGVTINRTYEFSINDETVLSKAVDKIITMSDVYIKSLPTGFDSDTMGVRFTASGKDEKECLKKIESAKNSLKAVLNEF